MKWLSGRGPVIEPPRDEIQQWAIDHGADFRDMTPEQSARFREHNLLLRHGIKLEAALFWRHLVAREVVCD